MDEATASVGADITALGVIYEFLIVWHESYEHSRFFRIPAELYYKSGIFLLYLRGLEGVCCAVLSYILYISVQKIKGKQIFILFPISAAILLLLLQGFLFGVPTFLATAIHFPIANAYAVSFLIHALILKRNSDLKD